MESKRGSTGREKPQPHHPRGRDYTPAGVDAGRTSNGSDISEDLASWTCRDVEAYRGTDGRTHHRFIDGAEVTQASILAAKYAAQAERLAALEEIVGGNDHAPHSVIVRTLTRLAEKYGVSCVMSGVRVFGVLHGIENGGVEKIDK